jgi:hypothetical protein
MTTYTFEEQRVIPPLAWHETHRNSSMVRSQVSTEHEEQQIVVEKLVNTSCPMRRSIVVMKKHS